MCPWFYRMKALIGERPNAKPVGIGNSASELNLDVLAPGTQDNSLEDAEPIMPSENDDDEEDQVEDQHRTQNKHSVLSRREVSTIQDAMTYLVG